MRQEYIVGDIVMCDNEIMTVTGVDSVILELTSKNYEYYICRRSN